MQSAWSYKKGDIKYVLVRVLEGCLKFVWKHASFMFLAKYSERIFLILKINLYCNCFFFSLKAASRRIRFTYQSVNGWRSVLGTGLRVTGGYHTESGHLFENGLPCVAGKLHCPVNLHWTTVVFLLHKFC